MNRTTKRLDTLHCGSHFHRLATVAQNRAHSESDRLDGFTIYRESRLHLYISPRQETEFLIFCRSTLLSRPSANLHSKLLNYRPNRKRMTAPTAWEYGNKFKTVYYLHCGLRPYLMVCHRHQPLFMYCDLRRFLASNDFHNVTVHL